MKAWGIIVGFFIIIAMVCTPAIAISKSDLLSQYSSGQVSVDITAKFPLSERPSQGDLTSVFSPAKQLYLWKLSLPLTCPPDEPIGGLHPGVMALQFDEETGEVTPLFFDDRMRVFIVEEGCQCPITPWKPKWERI
jgi:hypothetical protein